jgi:hypothetical protein
VNDETSTQASRDLADFVDEDSDACLRVSDRLLFFIECLGCAISFAIAIGTRAQRFQARVNRGLRLRDQFRQSRAIRFQNGRLVRPLPVIGSIS